MLPCSDASDLSAGTYYLGEGCTLIKMMFFIMMPCCKMQESVCRHVPCFAMALISGQRALGEFDSMLNIPELVC